MLIVNSFLIGMIFGVMISRCLLKNGLICTKIGSMLGNTISKEIRHE